MHRARCQLLLRLLLSIGVPCAMLTTTPLARAAGAPADFAGVYSQAAFGTPLSEAMVTLSAQREAGVRIIRLPFNWWQMEPAEGRFDFQRYDELMTRMAAARMRVLPVLMSPPDHRSSQPARNRSSGYYPPRRDSDMGAFAAALVRRYGPAGSFWTDNPTLPQLPIRSWQVWNEPNLPVWWASGPDPAAYTRLLEAVGTAIEQADPGAEVVAAGLPQSTSGTPLLEYLRGMYRAGARGTFDTMAVHPYAADAQGVVRLVRQVRQVMHEYGDSSALWVTEVGWATAGRDSTFTLDEPGQAAELETALRTLTEERSALGLRGVAYFAWQDVPPAPDRDLWLYHTGLLRRDGTAKPAFEAFRQWARRFSSPDAGDAPTGKAPVGGGPAGAGLGGRPPSPADAGRPRVGLVAPRRAPLGPRRRAFRVRVLPRSGSIARHQVEVKPPGRRRYLAVPTARGRWTVTIPAVREGRYRVRARGVDRKRRPGPWTYARTIVGA